MANFPSCLGGHQKSRSAAQIPELLYLGPSFLFHTLFEAARPILPTFLYSHNLFPLFFAVVAACRSAAQIKSSFQTTPGFAGLNGLTTIDYSLTTNCAASRSRAETPESRYLGPKMFNPQTISI